MNKTRIFNEFEKGNICVFNNESCGRDFLIEYAYLGNSIEESRAISYKTFKNYFVEDIKNRVSATSITRLLFVIDFLNKNTLSYFISEKYPESLDILTNYVASILPSLKRVKENEALSSLPPSMISDINKLYESYIAFLDERELYEESFLEMSFDMASYRVKNNNYSIIAPDTMPDFSRFLNKIGNPSNISTIDSLDWEPNVFIEKFDNCSAELATQIRRIKYNLENGINPSDIGITLTSFDNQIEDLKTEAKKYDIPLNVSPSTTLINYPMGKFFYNLKLLFEQRFSLDYMKSFFLDRSYPFKNRSLIRGIIRVGIDANVAHGRVDSIEDSWEVTLSPALKTRAEDIELFEKYHQLYTSFKSLLISLNTAKNKDEINHSINNIIDFLFDEDRDESDDDRDCFDRVMEEFNSFFDSMELCNIENINNLYARLIDQIGSVKYELSGRNNDGISVYSYPTSSTLNIKYHYIMGVNHADSEVIHTPLSVLPPSIDEKYREEENLSASILRDYISAEYPPFISYSAEDYSGSQLPPSFFIENSLVKEIPFDLPQVSNAYKDEVDFFALKRDEFKTTTLQRLGFENANLNILTSLIHDMANRKISGEFKDSVLSFLKSDNGEYKLSSTSIDSFQRCPYQWALKYVMKIREESYDSVPFDHLEVGNFLHKVMEVFFRKVEREDKRFFSSFLEKYNENLEEIFYQELNNYRNSDKSPSPSSLIYIEDNFKPKVMGILNQEASMFDSCSYHGFEENFSLSDKVNVVDENGIIINEIRYRLDGKVDKIVELQDEGYVIVDYKKGSATIKNKAFIKGLEEHELKSYQFPCYRKLMKSKNMDAKSAAYYGFNDGKYEVVWEDNGKIDLKLIDELFEMVLEKTLIQIEDGDFRATPSKDHCSMCKFRQVCRKRYSTK